MTAPGARVIFLFVDGVGIGSADPARNPFFAQDLPALRGLAGGALPRLRDARRSGPTASWVPLNATLGVAGLPQSGTGQTALLTGINAPKLIGKHFGPYPYSTLRPVLNQQNIFVRLQQNGARVGYANAFPERYFEYMQARPAMRAALSSAWLATGRPLRTSEALGAGEALSADVTSEKWNRQGFPAAPVVTPAEAGARLVRMSAEHDLLLFEYYETDHAGHSGSMEEASAVLVKLDAFIGGIVEAMDHSSTLLVVTSDHGNLEDLSVRTHTRNPVPLVAAGRGHASFVRTLRSLTDVAPALLGTLRP